MFDLFREIIQTLSHNKLRTALTGFAVAWGIFLLIVLLGLSKGMINAFEAGMNPDATSSMNVWGGWTSKPYKGYKEGRRIELLNTDIKALEADNRSHIKSVSATKTLDSAMVSTQRDYLTDGMSGVFPEDANLSRIDMISGRFINQADMEQKRKVVVLSEKNAEQLFGSAGNDVGKRVNAMKLSWLVVGVYSHPWQSKTYTPYTTALELSGNNGRVGEITVIASNLQSEADGEELESNIRSTLSRTRSFDKDDTGAVHIWNRFNNYLTSQTAMGLLTTFIWVLGILTLLTGIVGVSNIMFVSVRERTHEIGIRRAIGAKPRSIMLQVVTESVAITTLFGYIGIVAGMALTAGLGALIGNNEVILNPGVDLSIAVEVTIVLIIAGAMAGLFPAIKSTKVKPVEALRDE